jgi:hypothetical protein
VKTFKVELSELGRELVRLYQQDWDSYEESWGYRSYPIDKDTKCLKQHLENIITENKKNFEQVCSLERKVNRLVTEFYHLTHVFSNVQALDITLKRNSEFKVQKNLDKESADIVSRDSLNRELISYFIGCNMGRYSLDREGLVYAHSGNEGFDKLVVESAYTTFHPDEDGIIPLTDQEWFKDDATNRFREFVKVVWGEEHLQENLDFVAESLCLNAIKPKKSEPAMETIRRYLSTQFYKDHLKTYKKRPIYWLFSSGKQKAFECLVYLHRYNEGTLSRMRTEYVTPLLGKYDAYIDQLKQQVENADSTAEANRLKKEQDALIKKQVELREFDDKLKHYADVRISLDLDDGVKVNYGKFGDLLSDVKAITGSDSGAE